MTIRPDGTYAFASTRTIGVFGGSNTLRLKDGQLRDDSETGHATFTLYDRNGDQVIMVDALEAKNDYTYRAELTRAP